MALCLRNDSGSSFSGIFLQRIKALGRMGMVTNPILYSECMYRYT